MKDAPPEALEVASFQLDKAKERSVEVPLIVGPPASLNEGAEVTIRRIPDNPGDRRPDLFVRLTPAGERACGHQPLPRRRPLERRRERSRLHAG